MAGNSLLTLAALGDKTQTELILFVSLSQDNVFQFVGWNISIGPIKWELFFNSLGETVTLAKLIKAIFLFIGWNITIGPI
jgi:hypothetical protein